MDAHAERRVVTCLIIDVVGSTDLIGGLGPEKMRRRLGVAFEEMSARIEEHGGTVEKFVGDAIFAMFGAPTSHVDDPHRALRAALACRDWSAEAFANDRLSVRIGLVLGRLDECATGGSRVAKAVAAAVREERAADLDGSAAPKHSQLKTLGYNGLSDLLKFRAPSTGPH